MPSRGLWPSIVLALSLSLNGLPRSAHSRVADEPCQEQQIGTVALKVWAADLASSLGRYRQEQTVQQSVEISAQLWNDGESPRAAARSFAILYGIDKGSENHVRATLAMAKKKQAGPVGVLSLLRFVIRP